MHLVVLVPMHYGAKCQYTLRVWQVGWWRAARRGDAPRDVRSKPHARCTQDADGVVARGSSFRDAGDSVVRRNGRDAADDGAAAPWPLAMPTLPLAHSAPRSETASVRNCEAETATTRPPASDRTARGSVSFAPTAPLPPGRPAHAAARSAGVRIGASSPRRGASSSSRSRPARCAPRGRRGN